MVIEALRQFDAWLERYSELRPLNATLLLGVSLILIRYGVAGDLFGISQFSPDSWAYYELAGTVLGGDFYAFNTWRSYFADPHSASFPLGYPVVIALVQLVVGATPMAAVWVNVVSAALTWGIGIRLAIRLGAPAFAALVLSSALVLSPSYLDEVFAGRSIPLAVLWVVLAVAAYLRSHSLIGGLFLGLAALTRFDFVVVALLILVGAALFDKAARGQVGWSLAGLLLGMAPWIVYSWLHFGRFWVSDNSWVALSALPASVLDFPARASVTVFDEPMLWLARVFGNISGLLRVLGDAVLRFPPLIALLILAVWASRGVPRDRMRRFGLALLMMAVSLAPYVLTGYFEKRYFLLLLTAWSLTLALLFTPSARPLMHGLLAVALGSSLVIGERYLASASWYSNSKVQKTIAEQDTDLLRALHECHLEQPERTMIFSMSSNVLTAHYGATTGMKTACMPNNFNRMSEMEKQAYFTHMEPFLVVDESFEPSECFAHD